MAEVFQTRVQMGSGTNSDIDAAEEDILVVTDQAVLKVNSVSLYVDTTLGTHTSMEYRLYFRATSGGTWFPLVQHNLSTGEVEDYNFTATAAVSDFVVSVDMPSCFAFKVTGIGIGGANGAATVTALGRYS